MSRLIKFPLICLLVILSSFFSFFPSPANAQERNYSSDEVLVKVRPSLKSEERLKFHREINATLISNIQALNIDILRLQPNLVERTIERLRYDPRIEYAEPNYKAYASELTNDYGIVENLQWGMFRILAASPLESAWNLSQGSEDVKVAVLDTGIDTDHEDLSDKIIATHNCSNSKTINDLNGHGTHVAGIIGAKTNNGIGVSGIAYNSSLINAKTLDDSGSGYYSWIVNCLIWAADNGANVINLSLGGKSSSKAMEDAINYAWNKGVVVVAAAGNSSTSTRYYPASYENVIAVAATDQNDRIASFSNYGSWVDVAAPGVSIYSTLPNHQNSFRKLYYGNASGTSMAAPHVAGLAALLFSLNQMNNVQVVAAIEDNADKITGSGSLWKYGRINAYLSLASYLPQGINPTSTPPLVSPTPTPSPTPTVTPTPTPLPTPTFTPTATPSVSSPFYPPIPPKPPIFRPNRCFFLHC